MKNKFLMLILVFALSINTYAQSKIIVGEKHTILAVIPNYWVQAENETLPFFIKPDETDVSPLTYMYVYGIDYDINPEIEKWISGNNEHLKKNYPRIIIRSIELDFTNLKQSDYYTGKSQIITYKYPDKRKESILVIECKNSIITVVLSAENETRYNEYQKAFFELGKSIKILETELKRE